MSDNNLTRRAIVLNFMDMMKQFLTAMREVFPDCPKVVAYDTAFTLRTIGKTPDIMEEMGVEAMREYHIVMAPWYARCTRRDERLLQENIEFLTNLDMPAKWNNTMHPETKEAIWEYINQLNNFCCLMSWTHDLMPANIMSVITSNASEMAEKIKSGEMSMSDINVMDLSQKIMASIDAQDLEDLGSRLHAGNGLDITSIYAMLNNMIPRGVADTTGVSALLSSMIPSSN